MILVKHETKTIRPFLHADDLRNAFANTSIRMKAGDDFAIEEAVIIRDEDQPLLEPAIFPHIDQASVIAVLSQMGIAEDDVQIMLIATSHTMRLSETIAAFALNELPEYEIALRPKINPLLASKTGYEITIAMLLAKELPREALKPTAFGQWLSKKTFYVRPEQPSNAFRILPLNEETRNRLSLPEGTLHFVEMNGSLNDPEATLENCLTIWVADSIYNSLSRDDASKASVAIQKMLLSSITLSVVVEEVASLEDGELPEPGSPLEGFFSDLAKETGVSQDKLVAYARSTGDKARLGAYIQKVLQVNGAIKAAM